MAVAKMPPAAIGWASRRRGRVILAVLTFMVLSGALIVGVWHYYLIPALSALPAADPNQRKLLGAHAFLLMLMLLLLLGCLLVVTFRVSRFFFPRPRPPKSRTPYIDAWSESGRRMDVPPPEDEQEHQQEP